MFSPSGLFGFCSDPEGEEAFFHAQDFHRVGQGEPPPILGEPVEVGPLSEGEGKRPRVSLVRRINVPIALEGSLRSFDANRGWGFIQLPDGKNVFLHMSDRAVEWMPIIGSKIQFYLGSKNGKSRACWARPLSSQAIV